MEYLVGLKTRPKLELSTWECRNNTYPIPPLCQETFLQACHKGLEESHWKRAGVWGLPLILPTLGLQNTTLEERML